MRIAVISDFHGRWGDLHLYLPDHDVLCICGDMMGVGDLSNFEARLKELTSSPICIIPGNHDVPLIDWVPQTRRIHNLIDCSIEINDVVFAGFPWTDYAAHPDVAEIFAYACKTEEEILAHVDQIIECDVLLSHAPPKYILDKTFDGDHIGIPGMLEKAKSIGCSVVVSGHIHEEGGKSEIVNDVLIVNAAQAVISIEYEEKTTKCILQRSGFEY